MSLLDLNKVMAEYKRINKYEEGKQLVAKWGETGLLEGIDPDNEWELHSMARVLDNQAKELIDEASRTGTTSNLEAWSDIALPLVRRTFGKIVAQDLMSVQPMSMPSGLVFWLYFNFGTSKPANTGIYSSGESLYGHTSASNPSGSAMGALYNFDYSYTKNYVSSSNVSVSMTTASWADFNYDADISASISATGKDFHKVTVAFSALTRPDKLAAQAYTLNDSNVDTLYRQYTTADDTNIYFIVSGAHDTQMSTVEYIQQSTQDIRGDFEAGQSGVGAIPEIDIKLQSKAISANTRKLKAIWTPEIAQDLNAFHSLDAEAELTNVVSEFMAMETDMELLSMVWEKSLVTDFWSAKPGAYVNSSDGSYISGPPAFYGTEMDWYQTLIKKITHVSNQIHKRTLRGGANWLVVGTTIATILESMKPGFTSDDASVESTEYAMGLQRVGTLNNKWKVYKNPYFREDAILLGFRGNSFLETGAVYLPYVPIIASPTVYHQDDFTPRKGMMTRYAKYVTRPEFYGKIIVRDLNFI